MERVIVSWSGGKDSVLALEAVLNAGHYEIASLLTVVTKDYDRISMHGVRRALLKKQAEALGMQLEEVEISKESTSKEYESNMRQTLSKFKRKDVNAVVFGDIFLEDVRKYREDKLGTLDMHGIFPLWNVDTRELAARFIRNGFRAIITCVDTKVMGMEFAGRELEYELLSELPDGADPCGENGEYHSFVYDGPFFQRRVEFTIGEKVLRENRFYFCDLLESNKNDSRA